MGTADVGDGSSATAAATVLDDVRRIMGDDTVIARDSPAPDGYGVRSWPSIPRSWPG